MNEAMKDITWIGDSREQVRSFLKPCEGLSVKRYVLPSTALNTPKQNRCGALDLVWGKLSHVTIQTHTVLFTLSKLARKIYVLHAFQKKSTRGIRTPKQEIDLIKQRLKIVQQMEAKQ